jgi:signal transduction histidine kinase/phage shock protein PspC (stress-responsive transcriptional regulator)
MATNQRTASTEPAAPDPARGPGTGRGWFGVTRSGRDRLAAGVAAGLGERLAVDPVFVRAAFVALAAAGGAGMVAYLLLWAVSAEPGTPAAQPEPARQRRPSPGPRRALALWLQTLGALFMLRQAGWWFGDAVVWPVTLAALGSAIIWARSDDRERARLAKLAGGLPGTWQASVFSAPISPARLAVGAGLVAVGVAISLINNANLVNAWSVVVAVLVTTAGLALVLGPFLWRMGRQVNDERRARIRSQERAEMAAHLHDSVLHTLALIQRTPDQRVAASLARGQERELRAWLAGRSGDDAALLSTAVDVMAGRVERLHAVPVEAVVVGEAPMDEQASAIVDAAGEAAANAARHAGAKAVSIYVEVEPEQLSAFVRDEGKGFDPDAVPADRRGIAESIVGRMRRHGGDAVITSEPGEGTEVAMQLPRRRP